jgi:hypothetical protein
MKTRRTAPALRAVTALGCLLIAFSMISLPLAGATSATARQDVNGFGDAPFRGSTVALTLNQPLVGMARSISGNGYWLVAADGGVFTFGDARYFGSAASLPLRSPIVGMTPTSDGKGYWLVASDGGVFTFGDARYFGSAAGIDLNGPIVDIVATASGRGYWLVGADGSVFTFGDATFRGSTGSRSLTDPIVGMATRPNGEGYWLAASNGAVFAFGDARDYGSAAGDLAQPIVGIAPSHTGNGYWLVGRDGGVFAFGDAKFYGSDRSAPGPSPVSASAPASSVVGIAPSPSGRGYWIVATGVVGEPLTSLSSRPVSPLLRSFGAGTFHVGATMVAGTYHNSTSSGNCYWARLRGFTGTVDDVIAANFTTSLQIVAINAHDAGFESNSCGVWKLDTIALTKSPKLPFKDGAYRIGRDVAAGTWRNGSSAHGCLWQRLSGFGGRSSEVIAANYATRRQTVKIRPNDLGFDSQNCGTWKRIRG